jgi:hypothetical protein
MSRHIRVKPRSVKFHDNPYGASKVAPCEQTKTDRRGESNRHILVTILRIIAKLCMYFGADDALFLLTVKYVFETVHHWGNII